MNRKVSSQWYFLSWVCFAIAVGTFSIGIYNLDATLSVKGFYVQSLVLIIFSSINLQKTVSEKLVEDERAFDEMKLAQKNADEKDK